LRLVSRMAIAAPFVFVTVTATSLNGICALLA